MIEYSRNVYMDNAVTEGIKCVHLLDEEFGIEKIGLIAREMCEIAAESACESTYCAVARTITKTASLSISHQSVWNIVQKLGEQIARHGELACLGRGAASRRSSYMRRMTVFASNCREKTGRSTG